MYAADVCPSMLMVIPAWLAMASRAWVKFWSSRFMVTRRSAKGLSSAWA